MKRKYLYIIFLIFTISSVVSCKKIKKPDAEIEREEWIAGFSDSVEYYQDLSRQISEHLDLINSKIGNMLDNFELIKKPREVSGYYLLKGWSKKIPFTTTAIYARINENEKFELIATLAGATFNRISVGDFYSETVPHDQAFNYRHDRYNTVYFSSGKADTIGEYIYNHQGDKINLKFLEGSKEKNFIIPNDEKEMISQTWNLYHSKLEAHELQKELWIASRKIEAFRRMLDSQNKLENN